LLTDEALVSEIQNGNEAAMELLVKRHYNLVYSYICRKLCDHHRANDLTQEVFIKMLKSIENLKLDEGKFVNWLLKIAVNTCRDYFKSSQFKHHTREYELQEEVSYNPNIVYLLERKEEIHKIKSALSELPEFQREAIILKFYHQKKFSEIAQITGCNESTAKSRVKQGLEKLKSLLKGSEISYERIQQRQTEKI
jgi:RNA polymerase sigma factor (sigma-70 family)